MPDYCSICGTIWGGCRCFPKIDIRLTTQPIPLNRGICMEIQDGGQKHENIFCKKN